MAAVEYGTIGIKLMGEWVAGTQYDLLNQVSYDGSSYVVHTKPPTGTLPTDLGYWQVSAQGTGKATANSVGTVKPDGTTTEVSTDGSISVKTALQNALGLVKGSDGIKVESDGSIDVNTLFTQATELGNIIAGEAIATALGKISKSIAVTIGLDQNALLKNMLTNMDADDSNKIPTSAYIHKLTERIGMGEELAIGANLTAAFNALNSKLGGKLIVIESTFKTLGNDGKLVTTQLEGGEIEALGITPQNSIIVGWSAHNKASNTWWSNDTYPSINKVVKSNTYNISVTNLPQNGFSDYYISALSGKNIIGVNVKWTNYNVLMSTTTAKDNNIYINTINPYNATITDTGIATVYYYEDDNYVGIEPINCVVAKLRINLSTSKTMLQVQSHLPSQYDVGDKFRIVIYKFDNVIEITA